MNDPDVLKWLDSYQGQEWLNTHHEAIRWTHGNWARLKEDACSSVKDGHDGCLQRCGWHWDLCKLHLNHHDNFCDNMDHKYYELPELTDEILNWTHP